MSVLEKGMSIPAHEEFFVPGQPIPRISSLEIMSNPFPPVKKAKKGKKKAKK